MFLYFVSLSHAIPPRKLKAHALVLYYIRFYQLWPSVNVLAARYSLRGLFCCALALLSCGSSVFLACGRWGFFPRQTPLSLRDESGMPLFVSRMLSRFTPPSHSTDRTLEKHRLLCQDCF